MSETSILTRRFTRRHYKAECEEENCTDCRLEAAQDLIDALEQQTEAARAVIDSWEQGDLAGAVHGLELSLDEALAALANPTPTASVSPLDQDERLRRSITP